MTCPPRWKVVVKGCVASSLWCGESQVEAFLGVMAATVVNREALFLYHVQTGENNMTHVVYVGNFRVV